MINRRIDYFEAIVLATKNEKFIHSLGVYRCIVSSGRTRGIEIELTMSIASKEKGLFYAHNRFQRQVITPQQNHVRREKLRRPHRGDEQRSL
jgi:hypothetical protein